MVRKLRWSVKKHISEAFRAFECEVSVPKDSITLIFGLLTDFLWEINLDYFFYGENIFSISASTATTLEINKQIQF